MAHPETARAESTRQILVVDDDPSVREMLVRVLKSDGYSAWSAANARQALAITAEVPIDLVLLDVGLPGMDGWETFATLRHQNPRLTVIIITAKSHQRVIAEAVGAGAFFEKPFDFTELLRAIARLLAEPPPPRPAPGAAARLAAAEARESKAR